MQLFHEAPGRPSPGLLWSPAAGGFPSPAGRIEGTARRRHPPREQPWPPLVKGVFRAHSRQSPVPRPALGHGGTSPSCPWPPGAHTLAGGQLPSPGILLALLALTGLASTTATRLKLNLPALAGLLGAGQLVLHEAFTAFSGPALAPSRPARSGPATSRTTSVRFRSRTGIGQLEAPGLDSRDFFPADACRPRAGNAPLRCPPRPGRGGPVVPRGVAPPAAPAPCSGDARRRRGPGSHRLAGGVRAAAVAEPPARLPPRAARRRRIFLT